MPDPVHFPDRNFAEAMLAGKWNLAAILGRVQQAIGSNPKELRPLVRRILKNFTAPPSASELLAKLLADPTYEQLPLNVRRIYWTTPVMGLERGWKIPALRTSPVLANWLGITINELDWFADVQGRNPRQMERRLAHYTCRFVAKRGGFRILEIPKHRLKSIQRKILHEILSRIPVHSAAHGFCSGRSPSTFASDHVGKAVVWRVDLKDFFPSIRASRVHAIFRSAGYPTLVSRMLTGLCTTKLATGVRSPDSDSSLEIYRERHLPQGAPTSPALANLAAFGLDVRLSALSTACGATYSRYADDLVFSGDGDFARMRVRFRRAVWQIIAEEAFRANAVKSRWMTRGQRQHVTGLVVNQHLNIPRQAFDLLKAILTNCARTGPDGQNRLQIPDFRAHLLGRVAHVGSIAPERGKKLRAIFDRIVW